MPAAVPPSATRTSRSGTPLPRCCRPAVASPRAHTGPRTTVRGNEQQLGRLAAGPRHQPSHTQRRRHPRCELRRQMDPYYYLDPFCPGRCRPGFRHPQRLGHPGHLERHLQAARFQRHPHRQRVRYPVAEQRRHGRNLADDGFTATSVGAAGPHGPWPFNPGPSWHVKGDADFDFDGSPTSCGSRRWHAGHLADERPRRVTVGAAGTNPGPAWHIKGTCDFNFDGPPDILWQNDDGTPAILLMNGMSVLNLGAVGAVNPGRAGRSRASAISITTAGPTSCGRTATARRHLADGWH